MTYEQYKASQAYLKLQLQLCGIPNLLAEHKQRPYNYSHTPKPPPDPATLPPNLHGLTETDSDTLYKHLFSVRASIHTYREECRKLPRTVPEVRETVCAATVHQVFSKFRPSADLSVRFSMKDAEWGHRPKQLKGTGGYEDRKDAKHVTLCVSPAWEYSSGRIHKSIPQLVEKFFLIHSQKVGKVQRDGTEFHRIQSVHYSSGRLLWDGIPYMAINEDAQCYGRGSTIMEANMALMRMMAGQVRKRLRG